MPIEPELKDKVTRFARTEGKTTSEVVPAGAFLFPGVQGPETILLLFLPFLIFTQAVCDAADIDPDLSQVRITGANGFLKRRNGLIRQASLALRRQRLRSVPPAGVQFRFLLDQRLLPVRETLPHLFGQADGQPGRTVWLIVRRTLGEGATYSYFISNANRSAHLKNFVWLSGVRWAIEQCFEEAKSDLGMDHYEVRKFPGWRHHMLTCMLAHFFLWHMRIRWGKKSTSYYAVAA